MIYFLIRKPKGKSRMDNPETPGTRHRTKTPKTIKRRATPTNNSPILNFGVI
jgi:hypothetical protein